ncbi:MAG: UDP-3-O-(3-hydroxymyristoyl)glucosamine N-acyltransferase [Phycisphaerales bacterium]
MPIPLRELAARLGATVEGEGDPLIHGCAPIDTAGPDEITFVANRRYLRYLDSTRAAAVLVGADVQTPPSLRRIVCEDPYFAFRNALIELFGFRQHPDPMWLPAPTGDAPGPGDDLGSAATPPRVDPDAPRISRGASVHATATVGAAASIHPNAVVEAGATIGPRSTLYPGVYVGPNATVGADCILHPNVVIYDRCVLGDRVTLHANTVIGQDGFGFATHQGVHHKIPQTGIVVIEDDVEMGAGNAIERAAMGETRIGAGTKFADLISIGHGTTTGKGCLVVSLVGISGSVELGDYVVLGGQVGVAGHLRVGDFVQAAGRAGISSDVKDGMKVGGVPAIAHSKARRNMMAGADLDGLVKRVRALERELKRLGAD